MFAVDHVDGDVLEWTLTDDGATAERVTDYAPTIYCSAENRSALEEVRGHVDRLPGVAGTRFERWRTGFRHDPGPVLRVDCASLDAVTRVAHDLRGWGAPGEYRLYNVDLSREFRYCLETGADPVPGRDLRTLDLAVSERQLASDHVTEVEVCGDPIRGSPREVVERVHDCVVTMDPDVLFLSSAAVVPELYATAEKCGVDAFDLGRPSPVPVDGGYQELAGRSTYTSYGRVGHSPARYNVPGRVVVDRSNTFMWNHSNLAGCRYLVERSGIPLQELAWSSIGRILTGIQIREALARGVLVPWNSWRHEFFKSMRQLHDADRGGFTFAPDVGLHEDVHELDFSSLYPNVIATRNVSPETVRCDCHADGETDRVVPGLGYRICDDRGYLPDVLEPLIRDRDAIKEELRDGDLDPGRERALRGRSAAIKWVLVACFGYQGFSNAKFGRIECHEAINAFAREILLDAKDVLEDGGWRVVHGIVDSVWVTADEDREQTPLADLCDRITAETDVSLEYEAAYDWVAFVPRRDDDAGALTKYFGAERGADAFKFRGVECRQRSTCAFVVETQRALVGTLADTRDPEAVCDRLRRALGALARDAVDPADLVVTNRVSKSRDDYTRATRNAAALERAAHLGVEKHPGESVAYVVVDDDARPLDRVRLACEDPTTYDAAFYRDRLLRAAESVLSPLGWRRDRIERSLRDREDASLAAFT